MPTLLVSKLEQIIRQEVAMNNAVIFKNESHQDKPKSNLINGSRKRDALEALREAIARGDYPTLATVEAAIDVILPIITSGGSISTKGAA